MTRSVICLCVVALLIGVATSAMTSSAMADQPRVQQLAQDLCAKEAVALEKMRLYRQESTFKRLAQSGVAKGQVQVARDLLAKEVGTTKSLGPIKKQYCKTVDRAYMASSNNERKRVASELCHEVRARRNAKKFGITLIDNLTEQLKPVYQWHANWYNEDVLRATSLERLPKVAPTVMQVVKAC